MNLHAWHSSHRTSPDRVGLESFTPHIQLCSVYIAVFSPEFCKQRVKIKIAKGTTETKKGYTTAFVYNSKGYNRHFTIIQRVHCDWKGAVPFIKRMLILLHKVVSTILYS